MMSKKTSNTLVCRWTDCPLQSSPFETPDELSHHVDECHLDPCAHHDLFFCLWEGCKVYNKPSYSYGWLRRHTKEKHTKERPYKCLMNGCNMAFNSVEALQRHMMRHFKQTPPPPPHQTQSPKNVQSNVRTTEGATPLPMAPPLSEPHDDASSEIGSLSSTNSFLNSKAAGNARKRYSLKVRIPRHSLLCSIQSKKGPVAFNGAHLHDEVLDRKTMSVIRQTANILAVTDTHQSRPDTCVTVNAQIVGKRRKSSTVSQEDELLVRWKPRLLPDTWVPLSLYKEKRVLSLHELSRGQLSIMAESCLGFDNYFHRKSKRKPDTR